MKKKLLFIFALLCAVAQGAWAQKVVDLSTLTSDYEAQDGDVLTGELYGRNQPYEISIADGASITLRDATIKGYTKQEHSTSTNWINEFPGITCLGDATITLEGTNKVKGFGLEYPAILPGPPGKTLTIKGTGSLEAIPQSWGTGIGTGHSVVRDCGNIVIEGGNITANANQNGTNSSPGIGAGWNTSCGDITIKGGYVTVEGGDDTVGIGANRGDKTHCGKITITGGEVHTSCTRGPGIGSGYTGEGCHIYIYDGTVYAEGDAGIGGPEGSEIWIGGGEIHAKGKSGAGIGGIEESDGGTITIDGGTIYASGYIEGHVTGGAGIGGGKGAYGGTITINGGTIVATGGERAAGIGGGEGGTGGDIFIYGGDITAYGGKYGAGIGGGIDSRGGAIWITGGTVKAYGGTDAAGIGGGESGDSGSIVINGGDVYASGDGYGVGIGAGEDGDVDNTISINGGTVDAYGGLDIRRAIGGEDDEDYAPISIGDRVKVTDVSSGSALYYSYKIIRSAYKSYIRLKFEPCDHAGATYSFVNAEKHQCTCQWCGYFEEDHSFDNNNHCVCGYDEPFLSEITLDVSKDMQAMLSDMKDKTVDITFRGRKFIIDSEWNTLCLPFSMTAEQISNSPLNNSKIVELDTEKTTLSDGVLTIAYKTATEIEAGKPYMVKWVIDEETGDTHIDNPIFKNVTISAAAPTAVSAAGISFTGTFAPLALANGDKTRLWLDDDVRLRWASGQDEQVSPTWCYWNLGGLDASTLNAIVVTFDDGSRPIVELMDGMTDFSILSAFGEQEVNASLEGRELSAVQQADGTWQSRAYTLCLPFYAELFGTNADFTIYSKAEITQDGELLFTQEMLPFLYPGNAYLIVVNEGTLRLQEEGVTIIAEADEADDDMNSVLLNNGNGQIAGYWLGSLKEISHDEAVSRKAFTLASDGSFQRITDENPTWKWPAFRATFCATDLMTVDKLTTKYQLDANGVEDEEVDRSLPAPNSYQGDNEGDNEATGIAPVIHTIDRDGTERWFDLNGRQLSGKPTKKGVYIHRGKKQVVK